MKTYYKDDRVWITGAWDRFLFADILPLDCVYRRSLPNTFKMVKERKSRAMESLFVELLNNHGIDVVCRNPGFFEFASDKDQFLFNLRFGIYEYIKGP